MLGQLPSDLVPAISLVGGLFLLYMAISSAFERPMSERAARPAALSPGWIPDRVLARGLSPHPYLFWFLAVYGLLLFDRGAQSVASSE